MRGCVCVFDHPYFAVTDANGRFETPNAPARQWRLVVWHETAGYLGGAASRLGTPSPSPRRERVQRRTHADGVREARTRKE